MITLKDISTEVTLDIDIQCVCGNYLRLHKEPSRGDNRVVVSACEDCLQDLRNDLEDQKNTLETELNQRIEELNERINELNERIPN